MKKKRDKVERAGNTFPQHLSLALYPHLLLCLSLTPVCALKCEWKFQGNLEAESCIPRLLTRNNRMFWWLSLCVNLTGLRDNQRAGKTIFLWESVRRVSSRDRHFSWWSVLRRWSSCRWASLNNGGPEENKRWRKGYFVLLLELRHPSSSAQGHWHSWFSGLPTWTESHHKLSNVSISLHVSQFLIINLLISIYMKK